MKSIAHSRRENTISPVSNVFLNLLFIIYMLSCMLPIILIFIVSFSDEMSLITKGFSFFPDKFTFLAYEFLFKDSANIIRAYAVTIVITVTGTIINVLITAMYAYPLSRGTFPFKRSMTLLILLPNLFSGGLVPFYMVYTKIFHLQNTIFAMILPGIFGGFGAIIMRTYFKSNIPDSIVESAFMDGASELRIFATIVLPLAKPIIATQAFFTFLGYWNEWFNCALFIDNDKLWNIQFLMAKSIRELTFFKANLAQMGVYAQSEMDKVPNQAVRNAMAVVGMLPILVAFPFFQKYFVKGMVMGAIKG